MKQQHSIIWGIVLLIVVGATIGCFVTFAPNAIRYTFWIGLVDVLLMEIATGVYLIYNIFLATNRLKSKLPVAMHISIQTTVGLFFLAGVIIDILFLAVFNQSSSDAVFLGLVIAKWVLLIILTCIFWFAGHEGEEERPTLEQSNKERISMLDKVQQALVEVRHLPSTEEERLLKQKVSDELETLRNQVRSWTSARPKTMDENKSIEKLLNDLTSATDGLTNVPADGRKLVLTKIGDAARNMSRELRKPVPAS